MKYHTETLKLGVGKIRGTINLKPYIEMVIKNSGIRYGFGRVRVLHSTAGLISQEDEKGLLGKDLSELLDRLVPKGLGRYHDDLSQRSNIDPEERINGRAHLEDLLIGHRVEQFEVENGEVDFGEWPSIILIDFDPVGRKPREIKIAIMGE